MMKNCIIIGISGVTNGGKTTLTNHLKTHFPDAVVFNQDKYFVKPDSDKLTFDPEINHANWECLDVLEMDTMLADINESIATSHIARGQSGDSPPKLILIDGFLIFNYRPIMELVDKKYFITLTKEQCWERRKDRDDYEPLDVPGYFDKYVWPMYIKNKQEVEAEQNDITYLDGSDPMQDLLKPVLHDISRRLTGES